MSELVANGHAVVRRSAWIEVAAGVVCIATVFTASGAYDTDDLSLPHRFTLWLVIGALIVGQTILFEFIFRRALPATFIGRTLGLAAALGATVLAIASEVHWLKYTPLLPKEPDPFGAFVLFVSPLVLSIAGVTILRLRSDGGWNGAIDNVSSAFRQISTAPAIAGLLPPPARQRIPDWPIGVVRRLKASDHYLEVTTWAGTYFIRGRMQDALAMLDGDDGAQVHRSWWVARFEVAAVQRSGRDYVIELTDGTIIPVGRARVKILRALGWLE